MGFLALFLGLVEVDFEYVVCFLFLWDLLDRPDFRLSRDLRLPSLDLDLDLCFTDSSLSFKLNSRILLSRDFLELRLDLDRWREYLSEA